MKCGALCEMQMDGIWSRVGRDRAVKLAQMLWTSTLLCIGIHLENFIMVNWIEFFSSSAESMVSSIPEALSAFMLLLLWL